MRNLASRDGGGQSASRQLVAAAHQLDGARALDPVELGEVLVGEVARPVVHLDLANGLERAAQVLLDGGEALGARVGRRLARRTRRDRPRDGGDDCEGRDRDEEGGPGAQARAPSSAAASAAPAGRGAARAGQAASRPPAAMIPPAIQSHITSGRMSTEKRATPPSLRPAMTT